MKLKNSLVNTSEFFYNEMFNLSSKSKDRTSEAYIEKDKLANTSIIFYEDMLQTKY